VSICVFLLVGGIEHFVVLEGVEAMAERQKLDRDLRRQLEERESEVAFLRLKSFRRSTAADTVASTGSGLPNMALGGLDSGATLPSRL
jgi:hypothetical protein